MTLFDPRVFYCPYCRLSLDGSMASTAPRYDFAHLECVPSAERWRVEYRP